MKIRPFHHSMIRYSKTVTKMSKIIKMIEKKSRLIRREALKTDSSDRPVGKWRPVQ